MPTDDDDEGFSERRREERPRRRRPSRRDDYDDDEDHGRPDDYDEVGGLIPYKNGWALASYYLGVFSLIPCVGAFLAVLAIIFGFMGRSHARQHPDRKGGIHAIVGIVLGSVVLFLHLAALGFVLVTAKW